MNSFAKLSLSEDMITNLNNLKYTSMTPIQEESIPEILKGNDILAQAKTGSGKTAAFGIGILENLWVERFRIQSLILCPTRELADQVAGEMRRLARFKHNIKILTITGGMPQYRQEQSLRHQAHIVVGTPGRINRLLSKEKLSLRDINTIVLDEADRMLDMGFLEQISEIFEYAPQKRQTLCFSATFPDEIKKLTRKILNNPKEISVESQHTADVIEQHFFEAHYDDKSKATIALLSKYRPDSALIFCNTKDACRRIEGDLEEAGLSCLALHGDLEQRDRKEVLTRFANRSCRVLVATDVAARGIDIDELGAVINYDMPFETETYVHRIGRTARAGKVGHAYSLMKASEGYRLEEINKFTNNDFQVEKINLRAAGEPLDLEAPMVTLSVNGGRKNKISPGDILGALTAEGSISGSDVGKIDCGDFITFVAVNRDVAGTAFDILRTKMIKGRQLKAVMHG